LSTLDVHAGVKHGLITEQSTISPRVNNVVTGSFPEDIPFGADVIMISAGPSMNKLFAYYFLFFFSFFEVAVKNVCSIQ
jgi:hypothetical protein